MVNQNVPENDSKQLRRKATCEPLDHVSSELKDGHPASSGNMDCTDDLHVVLSDSSSIHSTDLPSMIRRYVAFQHAILTGDVI